MKAVLRPLLDRGTEFRLLNRITGRRAQVSRGDYDETCDDLKARTRLSHEGSRSRTSDQIAAIAASSAKLDAALRCSLRDGDHHSGHWTSALKRATAAMAAAANTTPNLDERPTGPDRDRPNRVGGHNFRADD